MLLVVNDVVDEDNYTINYNDDDEQGVMTMLFIANNTVRIVKNVMNLTMMMTITNTNMKMMTMITMLLLTWM